MGRIQRQKVINSQIHLSTFDGSRAHLNHSFVFSCCSSVESRDALPRQIDRAGAIQTALDLERSIRVILICLFCRHLHNVLDLRGIFQCQWCLPPSAVLCKSYASILLVADQLICEYFAYYYQWILMTFVITPQCRWALRLLFLSAPI